MPIEIMQECCGCGACSQICPQHCISMEPNNEGFLYPLINTRLCIECSFCSSVCPVINAKKQQSSQNYQMEQKECYGCNIKNEEIRQQSSSGGAFFLFANEVINQKGKVFACSLNDKNEAIHIGVNTSEELKCFFGSKYTQSIIGNTFNEIAKCLYENQKVLFCGTPCQAAGLFQYVKNHPQRNNLLIIDFICHGVPSPKVFSAYISFLEKKEKDKIISFKFRNKDKGWLSSGLQLGTSLVYKNGTKKRYFPAFRDFYMNGFLSDFYLRQSCYSCTFKTSSNHYSDITIGDFWGVKRECKNLYDKKGTSLVIINTKYGQEIWNKVKQNGIYCPVEFTQAISHNKPYFESAKYSKERISFFSDFKTKGFIYCKKKYLSPRIWIIKKSYELLKRKITQFTQFIKFSLVGVANTVICILVYYFCLYLKIPYTLSYSIGFIASVINSFLLNNKYVFINKQEKRIFVLFVKVFSSYFLSYLLSLALIYIIVDLIKISTYLAPIIKLFITIPLNFFLNKFWVFKDTKK